MDRADPRWLPILRVLSCNQPIARLLFLHVAAAYSRSVWGNR